ncbi:hypothetical protein F5B22DRAFT_638490 [Xylaria bambusicola]|uniref:uncharacterized protein n=1 Tax=Xylaria bambusicola TaxID=326684 RepID=UPI0020080C61|nr:uncharacterized protein F5B22DRAFT_638490 [Xylaria bambusicola]KAI0508779.1 hypothetical protein F5B22DRAFT_638490 [Xylaria bambusicola]
MSKRTTFTTISPLPSGITREVVIDFLHNHQEMIDLNPLIIERHPIPPPPHAPEEEERCVWWSLTDKISYLPGGLVTGEIAYTAAFNDLPNGIQTHCYAPLGTDIRERWSLGGTLPGEPLEPVEIGLGAPRQGLYLREDVELRCNFVMAGFVKKTLKKAHGALVDRLCQKAASACSKNPSPNLSPSGSISSQSGTEKIDLQATDTAYLAGHPNNRFSAGQTYSQPPYVQRNSHGNMTAPYGYVPYRRPVAPPPPRCNDSANGWVGGQPQHAPAELQ